MRRPLHLVSILALAAATASAAPVQFVACIGDSITQGVPSPNTPWCQLLQADKAGQKVAVINLGIGGTRCDQIESGANGVCPTCPSFAQRITGRGYTRVFLMCGANDLNQGLTADQIFGTGDTVGTRGPLLRMVRAAEALGIPVTVMTVTPLGGNAWYTGSVPARHMDLNARIRTLASATVTVVEAYNILATPSTTPVATAISTYPGDNLTMNASWQATPPDNLHVGSAGNRRLADGINATTGAFP